MVHCSPQYNLGCCVVLDTGLSWLGERLVDKRTGAKYGTFARVLQPMLMSKDPDSRLSWGLVYRFIPTHLLQERKDVDYFSPEYQADPDDPDWQEEAAGYRAVAAQHAPSLLAPMEQKQVQTRFLMAYNAHDRGRFL